MLFKNKINKLTHFKITNLSYLYKVCNLDNLSKLIEICLLSII